MKRVISTIGIATAALLLVVSLFSLVCRYVASTNHVVVLAATGFPYVSALALLAIALLLVLRRWIESAVAAVLLIVLAFPLLKVLFTWPDPPSAPQRGTALSVMTFNTRIGRADAAAVVREVGAHHVQLLLLQEMTPEELARLEAAGLAKLLPNSFTRPGERGSGVGIFSSLPLSDQREYPDFAIGVISARLTLSSGQPVTVFSSHLGAPWPQAADIWRAESSRLAGVLAQTPGLVIDSGDFNANTSLKPFRQLLDVGDVVDAATASGEPGIRTYPSNRGILPPLIGIDHVLLRGVDARSVQSVRIPDSDHRALVAELVVPLT